ncbi:MAG: flavodoxin FldB [Porticoccaceae bacterium]
MKPGANWASPVPADISVPVAGLFYGSSTCYTRMAAEQIAAALPDFRVEIHDIACTPLRIANRYRFVILGIPTWDYGELQEDWERAWPDLTAVDWCGKVVALYGLGDQEGYPEWFQDALGYLWKRITQLGATTIGLWPAAGYRFTHSVGLTSDGQHFLGLALDEASEFERSEARIRAWCRQIAEEFAARDGM